MENRIKLLMVDDEAQICELMQSHFTRRGYDVLIANSGKQAIDLTKANNPQIMLLDKKMPEMDGIQALEAIRQFNHDLKVIIVSADELDSETQARIKDLNVAAYMHKPVIIGELDALVAKVAL